MSDPRDSSIQLAQRLATRAMSLARSGASHDGSVVVLLGLARGDQEALRLARTRCQAAVDQDPTDVAASAATSLLAAAADATAD